MKIKVFSMTCFFALFGFGMVGCDNSQGGQGETSGNVVSAFFSEGEYVDLGLPSGTEWKTENENGFYTYNEAVDAFGDKLPTKEQMSELVGSCKWTWEGDGYKAVGPNGNSIFLPAAGYRDCSLGDIRRVGTKGNYWSSTLSPSGNAWALFLFSGEYGGSVRVHYGDDCSFGHSIRLVRD